MNRYVTTCVLLLGAALLASGCGVAKEVYKRDMNNLRSQINGLETEKGRLIQEKKNHLAEIDALRLQTGQLTGKQQELIRKLEEMKAQERKRREMFDRLRASLQEMISAGKLSVVMKRGMMIVQLREAILFDSGKSNLKVEGEDAIRELTQILAQIPKRTFQVAGHTDNVGSSEFNWKLSVNRALNVTLFMEQNGMVPTRISAAGFGMHAPDAGNDTEEGKAQNRRIEIILVPNLDELAMPSG